MRIKSLQVNRNTVIDLGFIFLGGGGAYCLLYDRSVRLSKICPRN